jgi:hypothetical protein
LTTSVPAPQKLPLWRLIAAVFMLCGMAAVLLLLAPVYLENFRLQQFVRDLAVRPDSKTTTDDTLRTTVLARARQLELPVAPDDVHITHPDGKLHLDMKYAVQKDFRLYQVDLHFHPGASSR